MDSVSQIFIKLSQTGRLFTYLHSGGHAFQFFAIYATSKKCYFVFLPHYNYDHCSLWNTPKLLFLFIEVVFSFYDEFLLQRNIGRQGQGLASKVTSIDQASPSSSPAILTGLILVFAFTFLYFFFLNFERLAHISDPVYSTVTD